MTNAQKWVSIFLLLFILLLVLSKMTGTNEGTNTSTYTETTLSENQTQKIDVESLLANNRCFTCHGRDLTGTGMAPSLAKVGENWKKPGLISYLQNPKAFLNNARLSALKENYGREMPAVENLSPEELDALAEYLLKK